jgi:hypothetical protein
MRDVTKFDYAAPAELFFCTGRGSVRRPVQYRRLSSGAESVRNAIEVMPADQLAGAILEVDENRFDGNQIRKLYDSRDPDSS